MVVDPPPGIAAGSGEMPLGVPVGMSVSAAVVVFVAIVPFFQLAVHVDAAMEVRIGLVYHRGADSLAGVAERNGKRSVALHGLGHCRAKTPAQTGQHDDMKEPQCQAQKVEGADVGKELLHVYTRFRLRATSASNMTTKTYHIA